MTTEQLRELLPVAPNGPPMTPGWYYCERGHKPHVFVEVRRDGTLMAGTGRVIYAYTVTRHAPIPSNADASQAKIEAIGEILAENGCDCECSCPCGEHDDDCDPCLGCRISAVIAGRGP